MHLTIDETLPKDGTAGTLVGRVADDCRPMRRGGPCKAASSI